MSEEYVILPQYPHIEIYPNGKIYSRLANKTLKQFNSGKGYPCVAFKCNGKKLTPFVHRLLALAYIPNPESKRCVNHIDGIKTNYSLSNLEWCTHYENTQHAIRIGLFKNSKRTGMPIEWIRSELEKIKPWDRSNSLKMWAEKHAIPYKTAKNWHKSFKNNKLMGV